MSSLDTISQQSAVPMMGPLPTHRAVIEVIDKMVFLLHRKYSKPSLQGCRLEVTISTTGQYTGTDHSWFCVKVKCSDLGSSESYLIELLPEFGQSLRKVIDAMQKMFCKECLWTERPGTENKQTLTWYALDDNGILQQHLEEAQMYETTENIVRTTAVCWRVVQSREHMMDESRKICKYLHRIKLFAPLCDIQFYLSNWGVVFSSKFALSRHTTFLGQRQMATDIQHYVSDDDDDEILHTDQIFPKRGSSFTIYSLSSTGNKRKIKLTAISALIPSPVVSEIGTPEINNKCNQIKLLLYGPGNLPLIVPGDCIPMCSLSQIIRLDDYGLLAENVVSEAAPDENTVSIDWLYKVRPSDRNWQEQLLEWDEKIDVTTYTILLVIILDSVMPSKHWFVKDDLLNLDVLRRDLLQLLSKQRNKIRKAVGQVLDKYLYNFNKLDAKHVLVEKSISTVSSAISDMLLGSKNSSFQESCLRSLSINSISSVRSQLQTCLWSIASECYDIASSSSHESMKKVVNKGRVPRTSEQEAKKKAIGFDELANAATELTELNHCPSIVTSIALNDTNQEIKQPASPFSCIAEYLNAYHPDDVSNEGQLGSNDLSLDINLPEPDIGSVRCTLDEDILVSKHTFNTTTSDTDSVQTYRVRPVKDYLLSVASFDQTVNENTEYIQKLNKWDAEEL